MPVNSRSHLRRLVPIRHPAHYNETVTKLKAPSRVRKGGVSYSTYLDQYLTKGPSLQILGGARPLGACAQRLGPLICVNLHILFSQSFLMKFTKVVLAEHLLLCCRPLTGEVGSGNRVNLVLGDADDLRCRWNGLAIA